MQTSVGEERIERSGGVGSDEAHLDCVRLAAALRRGMDMGTEILCGRVKATT